MSKKKNHIRSITIDPKLIWNAQKPHYNGWMCGHGAHGKNKYNRKNYSQLHIFIPIGGGQTSDK